MNKFTKKFLLALFSFLLFSTVAEELKAQPDNYCRPYRRGCTYEYCWNYYTYISLVQVTQGGELKFERSSGQENCYYFHEDETIKLRPGEEFCVRVRRYNQSYYNRCRIYIDWNADGVFRNAEYREHMVSYRRYGYNTWMDNTWCWNVPEDVEGKFRMRIYSNYYYDYGPCAIGYYWSYSGRTYCYHYGEGEDYIIEIESGVKDTYPSQDDILFAGERYNGETRDKDGEMIYFKKPSMIFSGNQPAGTSCQFYIFGPMPSENIVYRGLEQYPSTDTWIDVGNSGAEYTIQHSEGDYSYPKSPFGDGSFEANSGGTYGVYAYMDGTPKAKSNNFIVAWDDDLAASGIVSPKTNGDPQYFKYVRGQTIRITGKFKNVGLNDVKQFYGVARIWDPDGELIYTDTVPYSAPPKEILTTGDEVELDFEYVNYIRTGIYQFQLDAYLTSATDQEEYNDHYTRDYQTNPYTFEIAYAIQLQADAILDPKPDTTLLAGRPIFPVARFKNIGISDASDVPAAFKVIRTSDDEVVYESNLEVQDVPSGKYNLRIQDFDMMVINEPGEYKACIFITSIEDEVREDDTLCTYFYVEGGLEGTYTVGKQYDGQARNFKTIGDAMDELYRRGLAGSVVFQLTDDKYEVTGVGQTNPAWDFSSLIIGLGYDEETEETNMIKWMPHRNKAHSRGGIEIVLNAPNGKGILFGQNVAPANENAVMNSLQLPEYANSPGHIVLDGGKQKSFKFVLNSSSDVHGAAIYMGTGSQDITVRNCIFENNTQSIANRTKLPLVKYIGTEFIWDADSSGSGSSKDGYSAGIVSRGSLVKKEDLAEEDISFNLDTIPNSNNVIENNEITGFGYGVVSIGLGSLYNPDPEINTYLRYYNKNSLIKGNVIHDAARAGIVLGFEENATVKGNRIYDIEGSSEAIGILAGGQGRANLDGYNNIGLMITGNEISDLSAGDYVHGIRVEQDRIAYQGISGGLLYFPDKDENTVLANNVVRNLGSSDGSASLVGIHLMTRRNMQKSGWDMIIDADEDRYFTYDDKIVNNTVIVGDENSTSNDSPAAGIAIQNSNQAVLYNNAIMFEGSSFDGGSKAAAAVFFQGVQPKAGGLKSDRNAYWLGNADAAMFRFVETDDKGMILEEGSRDEYKTLNQWRQWTGADMNSVEADFSGDLMLKGNAPYMLRINDVPDVPEGSILNNRGDKLPYVTEDIDGNLRGPSGERYDIGAFEFDGTMYVSDIEMISIPAPGSYRAGNTVFSDAEYIMTTAPVNINTTLRNNGSLPQNDVDVELNIYKEDASDANSYMSSPVLTETMKASAKSAENAMLFFNLSDDDGDKFIPQTYSESGEYSVPALFKTMKNNVTPKYKIKVSVQSDEDNSNNILEKEVRFYIKKSHLSLLVSSENTMQNIYGTDPSQDHIGGNLNSDSLRNGLHGLGWYLDNHDYDLFDREGWEERAVNYDMYRSMFWSDGGEDKSLSRYQKMDLESFLDEGTPQIKRNLVIGSQDVIRELNDMSNGVSYDPDFAANVLRANTYAPDNPLGTGVSNDGNQVIGVAVGLDLTAEIGSSNYNWSTYQDLPPYCGLMEVQPEGPGLARIAYNYINHDASPDNATMGAALTALDRNVITLGVDWRHWKDIDDVLRPVIDFIERNGGNIVPVELAGFDAVAAGNRVDISWVTASELNSARFDIERAELNEAGKSGFVKIGEEKAAGKSSETIEYGPVSDYNVELGQTYVYRLKIVDLDGKWKYSGEVQVTMGSGAGITLGEVVPNPVTDIATMELTLGESKHLSIEVYDINGSLVKTLYNDNMDGGVHTLEIDLADVSSGKYTLLLRNGTTILRKDIRVTR